MIVTKISPGRYRVWVADVYLDFKTERDAERFCLAGHRSFLQSWMRDVR